MYFKNVIFVAKMCKYGIFVAKIGKYGIFVAKIYKYALIDRFQGSAGFLDSAANCAALVREGYGTEPPPAPGASTDEIFPKS